MTNISSITSFEALVIKGKQLGRRIGFPTANLEVREINLYEHLQGVYAVWVEFNHKQYKGMLNIGQRPSFEDFPPSVEVHILDFDENIYGKHLKISIQQKLREEKKFENIEALVAQLNKDKQKLLNLKM
ncbi:MAG: riboflavin kinase [Bacteroidales bacterium]